MSRPQVSITCPYFLYTGTSHNAPIMVCEGLLGTERQKFVGRTEMSKYIKKHCTKCGKGCALAEALDKRG